jgi:hypothetical protein
MRLSRKELLEAVRGHWYSTAVATCGSFVFFYASLNEDAIRSAFPFYWGPFGGLVWPAVKFWGGVAVFTLMLAFKNLGDDRARQDLVTAAHNIQLLLLTLPPRGWRDDYARAMAAMSDAMSELLPRHRPRELLDDALSEIIRRVLESIATLAFKFDASPTIGGKPAVYAANVMLFVPRAASDPPFEENIASCLRFVPSGTDLRSLRGVLVLRPELSYSASTGDRDTDIPVIALPVPQEARDDGRWKALPGAPLAFLHEGTDGYADVSQLHEWFDQDADFAPSIREQVIEYFSGEGGTSRSFVSRRLTFAGQDLGVLNLHSNKLNLLGVLDDDEGGGASVLRREEFFALMTPLLRELECATEMFVRGVAEGPAGLGRSPNGTSSLP